MWVFLVVPTVLGARQARAARHAGIDAKHLSTLAAPDGLHVFAASFNAGNRVFEGEAPDFDDLIEKLTAGHETAGDEADIVLLGMQEFSDKGYQFGTLARTKTLWKSLSQSRQGTLPDLSKEIARLATPPEEVKAAKRTLANQIQAFHEGASAALKDFQDKYGAQSHGFHKHLSDTSPVRVLSDNAIDEQQKMSTEIKQRLHAYNKAELEDPQVQFQNITAAAGELAAWGDKFPNISTIQGTLAPVHAWTEKALAAIQEVRERKFPNLLHHEQGQALWSLFREKVATSRELERQLVSSSEAMPGKFKDAVGTLHDSIKTEVKSAEEGVSASLLKDWNKISQDFANLGKDLDRLVADGKLEEKVAAAVVKGATQPGQDARALLDEWGGQNSLTMDRVLEPVALELEESGVEVRMEPQKYDSGWRCAAGVHYDTVLYAYVNPWSSWKIEPEEYESSKCTKHTSNTQTNLGCNIDNNVGVECGKVVNLLVFKAQKDGSSLRICALNTHMSFAGTAEERMSLIAAAMDETRAANCDAVVFLGDFNSRLHCEAGTESSLPAYEMMDSSGTSSLKYVLGKFCNGERCSLSGSAHTDLDELTQMLNHDTVSCFEEKSEGGYWNKKKVWRKINSANTLKRTGLQEPQLPSFAPTYKLVAPDKATQAEFGWSKCVKDEPMCFMNPSKKGKHNPAWTDRILVQTEPSSAKVEVTEYSRRPITAAFGSDHIPVVAQIVVSPV